MSVLTKSHCVDEGSVALSKRYTTTEINDLLVESVREAVSEVLGEKINWIMPAFWPELEASLGVRRNETLDRLDEVLSSLKEQFGEDGERTRRTIIEKLYAKVGVPLSYVRARSLTDYVKELEETLVSSTM